MNSQLDRNIFCIGGLPFDAITQQQAIGVLNEYVTLKQQCFLSTPNLNFVIASQSNKDFRDSVIHSELSFADGMPIVWMAKLLNIPIHERIAGSSLFEEMIHRDDLKKPLSVFFFGGQDGIAEIACERLKQGSYPGMHCVGSHNPGFGTVDEMSDPSIIEKINGKNVDFLLVSLGAGKGQSWIEFNRRKLQVPIISHLGAVVNFMAGTVARAPDWLQKLGLEWLWRIKEEPGLFKRYWHDGFRFILMLITQILPYSVWLRLSAGKILARNSSRKNLVTIERSETGSINIMLSGCHFHLNSNNFREELKSIDNLEDNDVVLDLGKTEYIDSAIVGLILIVKKIVQNKGNDFSVINASTSVIRIFRWLGAFYLLSSS